MTEASENPASSPSSAASPLPDRLTLGAFGAFVLLAGGAAVSIRFTFAELAPFWGAAARFFLGALVFWVIAILRKVETPRGKALTGAILYGALAVGAGFIFIYWGLTETPASRAQTLIALVPLFTLFFARLHGLEPIRLRGLFGSVLAVVGIAVVVGGSDEGSISLPHILAIIAGTASLAEAGVIAKHFPRTHPIATNAVGMTVGTVMLAAASLLSGEQRTIPTMPSTWIAFAYVVIFVTIFGFFLYLFVLGRWTASGASYGFVLVPLVTVVVATNLAGEQITLGFLVGAGFVLSGVLIGALLPSRIRLRSVSALAGRGDERPP